MRRPYVQGHLDSMCGVYSIVNADRLVNNSTKEESQKLFDSIIIYLWKKKLLKDILIGGITHRQVSGIMKSVVGDTIPLQLTNRKNFNNLKQWWNYSKEFLEASDNRAIMLSIGGKRHHLTVIQEMNERSMTLLDSSYSVRLNRRDCRLTDYLEGDRYVIYPSQTWYLGKEVPH